MTRYFTDREGEPPPRVNTVLSEEFIEAVVRGAERLCDTAWLARDWPIRCEEQPAIAGWIPGTDDALWISFELASRPDTSATDNGDTVTATVSQAAASQAPAGSSAVARQLEFKGVGIAKGAAQLAQVAKADGSGLGTAGTMRLAVRMK